MIGERDGREIDLHSPGVCPVDELVDAGGRDQVVAAGFDDQCGWSGGADEPVSGDRGVPFRVLGRCPADVHLEHRLCA